MFLYCEKGRLKGSDDLYALENRFGCFTSLGGRASVRHQVRLGSLKPRW